MSFHNFKLAMGAAVVLAACLAATPGMARPLASEMLLSQENVPETEGVPQLTTTEVQGRVTKIDGDQVEMRLSTGETRTYTISQDDQERNRLQVGSDLVLSVRGDTVLAISPASSSTTTSGTARTGEGSSSSSTSSSSSSTTVRRQTTVQQTRPAPAPAARPAPAVDDDQPQPVRGLW